MADRLEAISRQVASRWTKRGVATLKFMAAPVHGCYYLSTEMFYVEINIDGSTGRVAEAKVHHIDTTQANHQTTTNCPEIIECLTKGDFNRFVDHLEGLMSIYDMKNASPQDKSRGWSALSILEADLGKIYSTYKQFINSDVGSLIDSSPLGLVQPRAGGIPMRLTFFLPTYDLISPSAKALLPPSADKIMDEGLGLSVTVGIERSEKPQSLPVHSLVTLDKDGSPYEVPLSANNSATLPARYVLHLSSAMPLELNKCQDIIAVTGIPFVEEDVEGSPLLHLITNPNSTAKASSSRGLFVVISSCMTTL